MTLPNINLHQLITFYILATEGSFTAAAEKLFLTEPAVSQQIKHLQISMGVKLVYVKKRRVHLTQAGQTLFGYAEVIYDQAKRADMFLQQIRRGSLRVGTSISFSSIVTSAAVQFESLFPDTQLDIKSDSSYEIVGQLLDMQLDVAVVMKANYKTDGLRAIRISDAEKLVLVTGWSTPICTSDSLTLADLCDYPFLIPQKGSVTRELLLSRFRAEGLELRNPIVIQMDYLRYGKILADMGKGIAVMPEVEARSQVEQGRLRILHLANDISVAVNALVVKNTPQNKLVEEFIGLVKQAFDTSHTSSLPRANSPSQRQAA